MREFKFSIVTNGTEATEEISNAIYENGRDDCLVTSCDGVLSVMFGREAKSVSAAVESAINMLDEVGLNAIEVRAEPSVFKTV